MVLTNGRLKPEKAILVGVATPDITSAKANLYLEELALLAKTAGAEILHQYLQKRPSFESATLVGAGKLRQLAQQVEKDEIQLVLFDNDLTGTQVKKLESILKIKVLDRSGLILDIFARNAKTAEAKLQVEMAQLEYYLPRLTRAWTHLSRQTGGIGTRGPGETQLEVDRRLVRKRLSELRKKLDKYERIKINQHTRRYPTYHISLVGYTNAGKSSLMNLLTKAQVTVEDKLFSTLDATTRKIYLGPGKPAVLSDTVGFIRKLPHHLVESFKSTLTVVKESSLILHVVDAGDEEKENQMEVAASVLKDLGVEKISRLLIFNKTDRIEPNEIIRLQSRHPEAVFLSVLQEKGLSHLRAKLQEAYQRENPNPFTSGERAGNW